MANKPNLFLPATRDQHVTPVEFALPLYCRTLALLADQQNTSHLGEIAIFPSDSFVFTRNSMPSGAWVLLAGQARMSLRGRERSLRLSILLETGDVAGLPETLAAVPYKSTLRTISASLFFRIFHPSIELLLGCDPTFRSELAQSLAKNLRRATLRAAN